MTEVIRYIAVGFGIGVLVFGIWAIYLSSKFGRGNK